MLTVHPDVTLIHVTGQVNHPPDPARPWRLDVNLRPPEFMEVTFVLLYGGSERIVAQAADRAALERLVAENTLLKHPRLRWLTLTGPEGEVFRHPPPRDP